jgi:cytochrome bd ubiquinol oxidase subunit I
MVAVGATISAFWIIVANSWQQTPAGFIVQHNRAELTDFWAAVFNPSTLPRFFHTVDAALISGAFLMAGISAYIIRKGKQVDIAHKPLKFSIIFGLIAALLEVFPFGHIHARQVAQTQPEKFAVMQGVYTTQTGAPVTIFAFPTDYPPTLKAKVEIPGLLSWMTYDDFNAKIKGANEFPKADLPPIFLTFVSYHNMVALGMYFIFILALGIWFMFKKKLAGSKKYLRILTWSIPLPLIACQLGWIAAEVGRQPWIVYHLMRTKEAVSVTVGAPELLFSIILFALIYILLLYTFLKLLAKKVSHGFEPIAAKEA